MKKLLLIISVAFMFSCKNEAQSVTANGNFQVELLFTKDGCNVYRFNDGGRWVYWSDCRGKITEKHTTSNGKQTVYHTNETLNN